MREDVIRAHAELPSVCEHIHLPLQSGSSRILKAMRRTYDRARYLDRVALIREHLPDVALTTDIIVGFPGETEEDFEQTLEVVEQVGYDSAFTFVFSPRRGTEAATIAEGLVPHPVKVERMERLVEVVQQRAPARAPSASSGARSRCSSRAPRAPTPTRLRGRTRHNKVVNFTGLAAPGRADRRADRRRDQPDAGGRGAAARPRRWLSRLRPGEIDAAVRCIAVVATHRGGGTVASNTIRERDGPPTTRWHAEAIVLHSLAGRLRDRAGGRRIARSSAAASRWRRAKPEPNTPTRRLRSAGRRRRALPLAQARSPVRMTGCRRRRARRRVALTLYAADGAGEWPERTVSWPAGCIPTAGASAGAASGEVAFSAAAGTLVISEPNPAVKRSMLLDAAAIGGTLASFECGHDEPM